MSLRKIMAAMLVNRPRRRMMAAAYGAASYSVCMLALSPRHIRDGIWALLVCVALVWGIIEQCPDTKRKVTPDVQSELRLTS